MPDRYSVFIIILVLIYLTTIANGSSLDVDHLGSKNGEVTWSWFSWLINQYSAAIRVMWKMSSLPISPFLWMTQWVWQHLVLVPLTMATQATNIMYPVLIYCGTACACGLIIGGCSGFAVEAMSSAMIRASWGKQQLDNNKSRHCVNEKKNEDDYAPILSQEIGKLSNGDDNNNDMEADSTYWRRPSQHSPSSSLYRFSTSPDQLISNKPYSFYDDKPDEWNGDEDPEEIALFLRQRRKLQQQQQEQN